MEINYENMMNAIEDRNSTLKEDNGAPAKEKFNLMWDIIHSIATQDMYCPENKIEAMTMLIEVAEDYRVFFDSKI